MSAATNAPAAVTLQLRRTVQDWKAEVHRWPPIQSSVSRSAWPPRWSTGVRSRAGADGPLWHHQNGAREPRTASAMHRTRSSPPNTEGHSAARMARAERTSPRPSPRILDTQGWDIRTQRGALQEPPCHHSSSNESRNPEENSLNPHGDRVESEESQRSSILARHEQPDQIDRGELPSVCWIPSPQPEAANADTWSTW